MFFDYMHDGDYHMMDWLGIPWYYGWIFMLIGWGIFFGTGIIIAYFVHKDAIARNQRNPEVWVLIVLIFNVLGLIVYLLTRNNYPRETSTKTEMKN